MKTSKRPTPLHILTVKDKIQTQGNHKNPISHRMHRKNFDHQQKMTENNNGQKQLFITFGQKKNQEEGNERKEDEKHYPQHKLQSHINTIKYNNQNNELNKQKKFTIKMIQIQNKPNQHLPTHQKSNLNYFSKQKFISPKQQLLSYNAINTNSTPFKKTTQQPTFYPQQYTAIHQQQTNKENIKVQRKSNPTKNILNPQNQQNKTTQENTPQSPQHSYSNLPIDSNVKRYHNIPIFEKSKSIELQPNDQQILIKYKKNTHKSHTYQFPYPPKNQLHTEKTQQIGKTTQSLNNNNFIKTTQQNQQCISLIHQDNNFDQQQQIQKPQSQMVKSKTSSMNKNINSNENQSFDYQKNTNDILKLVANLGSNKSDRQMEKLKNKMKHQKNLKLKDYLRLTSLSNDVHYDKFNKSQTKIKSKNIINKPISYPLNDGPILDKTKTVINPQRSVSLIKASLRKKLEDAITTTHELFKLMEQDGELVGDEYEDLVFMCNFHRIFNENMFKTTDLLEDIFNEYQAKKEINKIIEKKEIITQQQVIQLLSPRKRKKKEDEMVSMNLVEKILIGFNVIKMDEIENNYNNSSNNSQILQKIN